MTRGNKLPTLVSLLILMVGFCSLGATAQSCGTVTVKTSPGPPPSVSGSCGAVTDPYYYSYQNDETLKTLTFTSETGFSPAEGLQEIPVTIPSPITIHQVHGQFAYAVWDTSCIGAITAEVRDQNGNVIAVAYPLQFGSSTIDVPVNNTFPTGLSITSLQMQFYQGECGKFTFSWKLVMN